MSGNKASPGHDGAGDDCMGKAIKYGALGVYTGFAVLPISYINTTFRKSYVSRGPWFMNVTLHALKTTTVFGTAGATFATASCLSASIREKDDYVNASIGGALAGSIFGVAYRNVHIGVIVASGAAIFCGLCKAYHGTYLPPTFKSPVSNRRKDRLA